MTRQVAFIGSYGPATRPAIHVVAVDDGIERVGGTGGVESPSYLAIDPTDRWLLAVSETGVATHGVEGRVHAFRLHATPVPRLEPTGVRPSMGDHPCHVAIHPDGRWVVVSNYGSGTVTILPLDDEGLGEPVAVLRHVGRGPDPRRQEAAHPHSALFTPDGRTLLVADLGIDRVVVYDFDVDAGTAGMREQVPTVPEGGPRHMAFVGDGGRLAVVNELTSSLTVFRHAAGHLTPVGTAPTVPSGTQGNLAADVHAVGDRVYVSNRGHDSIATFHIDGDGVPRRTAIRDAGGRTPRGFAPTPDGRSLLVAAQDDDRLVLLPVAESGEPGTPTATTSVARPTCVAFA